MKAAYALGTAPELTVWTDELLDVQFTAPLAAPVQFALEAPATAGPLGLDASSGRFTFRPAASDTMPFAVTVVARSDAGGAHAMQNIAVWPAAAHDVQPVAFDQEVIERLRGRRAQGRANCPLDVEDSGPSRPAARRGAATP